MAAAAATILLASVSALVLTRSASACPGSPARMMHAKSSLTIDIAQSCDIVREEVSARVAGSGGWTDPHNHGSYTMLDAGASKYTISRRTGDHQYTDKMDLQFTSQGTAGCQVTACSESQVTSYSDFSTNYCNLVRSLCPQTCSRPGYSGHLNDATIHLLR